MAISDLAKRTTAAVKRLAWGDNLVRRNPLYYGRITRLLQRLNHASLEERMEWHARRLRRVLDAARGTEYGRRVGADRIEAWPILEKETLRASISSVLTRPMMTLIPASTSGTTGVPTRMGRTLASITAEQAYIDFLCRQNGLELRDARTAVLRGDPAARTADGRVMPWTHYAHGAGRLAMSANHLSPATIGQYAAELRAFAPQCLLAYPDALASLLALLESVGQPLSIPYVLTSSEVLPNETRTAAGRILGARVLDYYGQAERVTFAHSDDGRHFWFSPGYGHVELIPVSDNPGHFEIIGTGFWNLAMPLVRYRTGDTIVVERGTTPKDLAEIAHGTRPFSAIVGRQNDYLLTPEGVRLSGAGLTLIPRDFERALKVQFVQEAPDTVKILVLASPGFGAADRDKLLATARAKLPDSIHVSVEQVAQLRRTARGKSPFVIRAFDEKASCSPGASS